MTSVLVVDDDAPLGRALARELRANGYESVPVSGYEEAIEHLAEHRYDVLLTDLRMGDKDGLDLILAIAESYPGTRPILMSAYATARDSERAKELGAVRVLCKPFDTSEMLHAVGRAVESAEGFIGSLHGLSLIDMLQMFHYAQRSLTVQVAGSSPATIHLRSGQIVHATIGAVVGEAALSQILTLPAGSLSTSRLEAVDETIARDFQVLMLDLLRRMDEQKRPGLSSEGVASLEPGLRPLSDSASRAGSDAAPADSSPSSSSPIELVLETSEPPPVAPVGLGPSAALIATRAGTGAAPVPGQPTDRPLLLLAPLGPGLLADACRRTAAELSGDVVCVVVDLDGPRLLGFYAARGDAAHRGEALARLTVALFRDAPVRGIVELLGHGPNGAPPGGLQRLELTLEAGHFLARATRQGRRVLALLLGRGTDARAARSQLDAVFPLVEALAP
jgi:CheY-like chemotaxis protein